MAQVRFIPSEGDIVVSTISARMLKDLLQSEAAHPTFGDVRVYINDRETPPDAEVEIAPDASIIVVEDRPRATAF